MNACKVIVVYKRREILFNHLDNRSPESLISNRYLTIILITLKHLVLLKKKKSVVSYECGPEGFSVIGDYCTTYMK